MRILSSPMSRRLAAAVVAAATLPLPLLALTADSDPEMHACMQDALTARADTLFPAVESFNRETEAAMRERDQRYVDAWNAATASDARIAVREADQAYRERTRDLKEAYGDLEREALTAFRQAERDCKDAFRQREKDRRDEERERERQEREASSASGN